MEIGGDRSSSTRDDAGLLFGTAADCDDDARLELDSTEVDIDFSERASI